MGPVAPLIVLAVFFGAAGLLVEGLRWALVIALFLALFAAAAAVRAGPGGWRRMGRDVRR